MRRYAVAALVLFLTAACSDNTSVEPGADVVARTAHSALISAPNFTMLPPIGSTVNPAVHFDASAPHIVEVCRTTTGECIIRLRTYEVGGSGNDRIKVEPGPGYFQASIKLSELGVNIQGNDRFAVRVRTNLSPSAQTLGGFVIAFNARLKGEIIVEGVSRSGHVSPTHNVAFKYRIGEGDADCSLLNDPSVNCLQVRVTNAGGTFINRDTSAGAKFPPNALPSGVSEVTLVVDRYVPNPLIPSPLPPNTFCLPDTNPQYNGCYIFTTEPKLESFNETIEIAICPDYEAVSTLGTQINQVDLWKWDGIDASTYQPLSSVESSFMECEEPLAPIGSASRSSSAFALARSALRPLAKLVMPTPLHAAAMRGKISPYGGGLNDFSTIGPVRRLRLETFSGDGANVLYGTTVTSSVRVFADGSQVASLNQSVSNVPVKFTLTSGEGMIIGSREVLTNADGVASVQWKVGPGVNLLRADGLNPRGMSPFNIPGVWGSQVFSAVGIIPQTEFAYGISFAAPIVKTAPGFALVDNFTSILVVRACAEDVSPRVCFIVPPSASILAAAAPSYQFGFASTTAMPAGTYSFTVSKAGTPIGLFSARARAVGEATAQGAANYAFTLGDAVAIRFQVMKRSLVAE